MLLLPILIVGIDIILSFSSVFRWERRFRRQTAEWESNQCVCVCFCAFFPSFTHRAVKKEFINLAKIIAPSRRDVQVIAAQQRGDCRINSRNAASTTRHRHTSPSKAWQVDSKSGPLEGGKMCSKASLMESYLINYTGSCLFSSPRAPFCLVLSFQLAVFFSRHDDNILYSLSYLPRLLLLIVFFF